MSHKTDLENLENGRKVVRNSIFILLLLTVIKAFGGYVTNMVALTGDAAGSFGDLIAQVAIFIGLTLSLRPPDKKFKYGYHRVETFMSLLIAVFITVIGYKILVEAITRLQNPVATQFAIVGIVASVISIGFSIVAFRSARRSSSMLISSPARYFVISESSLSAIASTKLCRAVSTSDFIFSGMGISTIRSPCSPSNSNAFNSSKSINPRNVDSIPMGN